jgi:hypothetical protein
MQVYLHDRRVEIPIENEATNGGCTFFVGCIREFVLNNVSEGKTWTDPEHTLTAIVVSRARNLMPYGIFVVDRVMAAMKASVHHLRTWRSRSDGD